MIFDILGRERYDLRCALGVQNKNVEQLIAQLSDVEAEKKALQASLDEFADANREIADEFTEQKRVNDRQARAIEEKLSQVADLKRENQTLAQQKSSLRHQVDTLETELDRRTAQLDKISGFLGPWAKRLLPSLEVIKKIEEGWTAVDGEYPWEREEIL
jgi:chromosome segregation ATPase